MLLKSGSHSPSVNPSAVIAPNATLVGDVRIGARCVIGYGSCLIVEGQPITLGEQVIVRDNAVIRSTAKYPGQVGNAVLITVVPQEATVPIGGIAVGDPLASFLRINTTRFGLSRSLWTFRQIDMHELTSRLSESARKHRPEEP